MAYAAKILLDSVSPVGYRLTTLEVTLPRIVLAEANTHRMLSRNSASSRAIPVQKQLERIIADPFMPVHWGMNQPGMVADQEIPADLLDECEQIWLEARDDAMRHAKRLMEKGVHKQVTNRLLEPFMWQTIIFSATTYANFFALRCHPEAQPEIRKAAVMMREAIDASTPQLLLPGQWHLPLVTNNDDDSLEAEGYTLEQVKLISAGRCARVSYLTHDGKRVPEKDIELAERLCGNGHMSPLEHVATPSRDPHGRHGNFIGWKQLRQYIPNEADFSANIT